MWNLILKRRAGLQQMYSTPTEGFLPPQLMSLPAAPAPCPWRAVGRAPLAVPRLFLQRCAKGQDKLSSRVWGVMQDDPAAQRVWRLIKCKRPGPEVPKATRRVWAGSAFLPAGSEGTKEPARCNLLAWTLPLGSSHGSSPEDAAPWRMLQLLTVTKLKDWSWKRLDFFGFVFFESLCYKCICCHVIRSINCMTSAGGTLR